MTHFKDMLSFDNLPISMKWFNRARLWRLYLTMDAEGFWLPSPGLAFALLASTSNSEARREAEATASAEKGVSLMRRISRRARAAATASVRIYLAGVTLRIPTGLTRRKQQKRNRGWSALTRGGRRSLLLSLPPPALAAQESLSGECPLSAFDVRAVVDTMPESLAALQGKMGVAQAQRIWVRGGGLRCLL